MSIKAKRMLIWAAMSIAGAGLMAAAMHRSVSGSLISAGGILAGISLLLNTHLVINKAGEISVAVRSSGYDRRGRFYARTGAVLLIAGLVVALCR